MDKLATYNRRIEPRLVVKMAVVAADVEVVAADVGVDQIELAVVVVADAAWAASVVDFGLDWAGRHPLSATWAGAVVVAVAAVEVALAELASGDAEAYATVGVVEAAMDRHSRLESHTWGVSEGAAAGLGPSSLEVPASQVVAAAVEPFRCRAVTYELDAAASGEESNGAAVPYA